MPYKYNILFIDDDKFHTWGLEQISMSSTVQVVLNLQ